MTFKEIIDFLENRMRMSHIYQPLLIKSLAEAGGSATIRQIAHAFLSQDESQLIYYEKRIKEMPLKALRSQGVLSNDGELISLNAKKLTFEQKAKIKMICDRKIQAFLFKKGLGTWDYRLLETDFRDDFTKDSDQDCRFCYNNIKSRIVKKTDAIVAILDAYPVTKDHHLIIPKRHTPDYFSLTRIEKEGIDDMIRALRIGILDNDPSVTGFNIGINNGESAGQTIFHAHVHLIPRRDGDTPEPRGGIRGVMPGTRGY